MSEAKLSKVEYVKIASHRLRGPVDAELNNGSDHFSEEGYQILKFHGIYQQDDRDVRKARKAQGLGPDYSFMIRVAIPGGVLTPEQYLALDRLADELGNATLRLTTRQAIQYHGVRKGGLKPLIQVLNRNLLTTLSACGDVVRNIVACPAPFVDRQRAELYRYAKALSERLKPKTRAYYEIWLDGERAASLEEAEPLYGDTYLPRKFKIGFAFPGDNCVDVYTQDIGIVPVMGEGGLEGFTLLVGGGLGQSHGAKETHPVLAKPLATVRPEQLFEVVEAIVKVQRDHGRRDDRKYSRMKYLVEAWGLERFRAEVERYVGYALPEARALEWLSGDDHLGWHPQGDGKLFFGLFVENGRVKENLRAAIREVVERFAPEVRLTAQQNLLFVGIDPSDQAALEAIFRDHGVALPGTLPLVVQNAMACPALPTCGLAITESERVMPQVIRQIDALLDRLGLKDGPIPHVRMTGCPNGCARPYSAEVGLVGRSLNSYTLYLGGSPLGTRLGEVYLDNVGREEIAARLEPVLEAYKRERREGEAFGDYCHRVGVKALQERFSDREASYGR
ncbi:NADPH-dependent assimilatory sulfite reductase hemoprotein subunit [Meiothermus sp. Pnk-1]|uniref:NADPH-dependent assimilatory sulfite reductase hemoprotein subunit n=1 Tax=Meiothermus sp. Pnk-1 TaxID=873128 RepID=UPI000D7BB3D5|nr:NADPH-dependent assimilatory sulfite reductase hemoprotein subunit [Meiothermus sp. Pnk-1]PZA07688.1 NADPH-dependent assimilatory sulfite reductase hemoprotein subunit [Meiothermus sp. Pnk-1]